MIDPSTGNGDRTVRSYPTRVLYLSIDSFAGTKRQEGDIIAHLPLSEFLSRGAPGLKEASQFLLLPVRGFEQTFMDRIVRYLQDDDVDDDEINGEIREKRRFCIPLHRLAQRYTFDMARVLDPDDPYQPFLPIDEDGPEGTQRYLDIPVRVLTIHGLVYDKLAGRYI